MAQVDSENSTATPVAPTRRLFLSTAATLAAGGAALGLAIPPALATADPIFVAIEAHKAAFARVIAAIDVEQAVEAAIPKGPTKGIDPRLIDSRKATSAAWNGMRCCHRIGQRSSRNHGRRRGSIKLCDFGRS